jgi:hypothetical protein
MIAYFIAIFLLKAWFILISFMCVILAQGCCGTSPLRVAPEP